MPKTFYDMDAPLGQFGSKLDDSWNVYTVTGRFPPAYPGDKWRKVLLRYACKKGELQANPVPFLQDPETVLFEELNGASFRVIHTEISELPDPPNYSEYKR